MREPTRNLYIVVPARVWEDRKLRPNGKLLYGELSALAQSEGYCWATNAYLAKSLGLSANTVCALIKQLRDRGYIEVEVERSPESNEVLSRKIWLCGPPGTCAPPPPKNEGRSPQNRGDPPLKNGEEINILDNKKDNTPLPPKGGSGSEQKKDKDKYQLDEDAKPVLRSYVGQDEELAQLLAGLMAIRARKRAINSALAVSRLLKRLDELSGGDRARKVALLDDAITKGWKTVYLPSGAQATPGQGAPGGRIVEEEGTYAL